jgi:hypothetical protein
MPGSIALGACATGDPTVDEVWAMAKPVIITVTVLAANQNLNMSCPPGARRQAEFARRFDVGTQR